MPMMMIAFRFPQAPDRDAIMNRLRAELGSVADERNLEVEWGGPSDLESDARHGVRFCSMDIIPLVYTVKVCHEVGGISLALGTGRDEHISPPAWAQRPWRSMNVFTRLKIRLGRIRFIHDDEDGAASSP
jgi:hypothetical protein